MRFKLLATAVLVIGVCAVSPAFLDTAHAAPALQFPWPTGQQHRITGGNGYGCGTHHDLDAWAIDFEFVYLQPVSAVAAGTVTSPPPDPYGYGNYVVLDHGAGVTSLYAHLASFAVSPGQRVRQGQTVGYADATGYTEPPGANHLHFRMVLNGGSYKPEPMSGVSGFGQYGACTGQASSYWVSKPPLGRDATNDGCPDVFARESGSPYVLRIYPGTCAGTLTGPGTPGSGWDPSQINPIIGSTFFDDGNCADVLVRERYSPYRLRVYHGNCTGSFPNVTSFGSGWDPTLLDNLMTPGDMTGDGCADVMARETWQPYVMRL